MYHKFVGSTHWPTESILPFSGTLATILPKLDANRSLCVGSESLKMRRAETRRSRHDADPYPYSIETAFDPE